MTRHLLRKSSYTLDENESEISCTQARLRRSGLEVKFFDQGLLELKYVYSTRLIHSHGMVAIALNMLRSVQYCTSTCNSMSTLCNKKNEEHTKNMQHGTLNLSIPRNSWLSQIQWSHWPTWPMQLTLQWMHDLGNTNANITTPLIYDASFFFLRQ